MTHRVVILGRLLTSHIDILGRLLTSLSGAANCLIDFPGRAELALTRDALASGRGASAGPRYKRVLGVGDAKWGHTVMVFLCFVVGVRGNKYTVGVLVSSRASIVSLSPVGIGPMRYQRRARA